MLGINVILWTTNLTRDHRPLLERLRSQGYGLIEVPLLQTDVASCRDLSALLDELGFDRTAVTIRFAGDNPISPDPAIRRLGIENSKRAVDCAAALGARVLGGPFHSAHGQMSGSGPTQEEWRWAVDGMAEVAEHAVSQGVTLAVEFLNRFECYLLNTTEAAARFVEDVGASNVGIHYDTHHAHIEDPNIGETLRGYGQHIQHVHLSENHRGTPGQGLVRWEETFGALREIDYRGHMVIEAFGQSVPELIAPGHVWRLNFESEDQLVRDAFAFLEPQVQRIRWVA